MVKNLPVFEFWLEDPWRKEWIPTPVFLLGEFCGKLQFIGLQRVGHD